MATEGAHMATEGAQMATEGAQMATDGAQMAANASMATEGAQMATEGAHMASASAQMAAEAAQVAAERLEPAAKEVLTTLVVAGNGPMDSALIDTEKPAKKPRKPGSGRPKGSRDKQPRKRRSGSAARRCKPRKNCEG